MLRRTDSIWGLRLCDGQLDLAELAVFYSFLAGTIDPLRKLSTIFSKLKRSTAAADRLFEILDRAPAVAAPAKPTPVPDRVHTLSFERIGFYYANAGRGAVLDGVTLTVNAGEVIAVVGSNGSGKSTLLKLVPRYFDPTHGAVKVNGIDLRDFDPAAWREKIGVVTQETLLFDESIAENIRLGKAGRDGRRGARRRRHRPRHRLRRRTAERAGRDRRRRRVEAVRRPAAAGGVRPGGAAGPGNPDPRRGHQRRRRALRAAHPRSPARSSRRVARCSSSPTRCVASLAELVTRVAVMEQGALAGVGAHADLLEDEPRLPPAVRSPDRRRRRRERRVRPRPRHRTGASGRPGRRSPVLNTAPIAPASPAPPAPAPIPGPRRSTPRTWIGSTPPTTPSRRPLLRRRRGRPRRPILRLAAHRPPMGDGRRVRPRASAEGRMAEVADAELRT